MRKTINIDAVYRKYRASMPEASDAQIERAVQKYLLRQQLKRPALLFLLALAAYFALDIYPSVFPNLDADTTLMIDRILKGVQSLSIIIGAMSFSRTMHDPLTPQQAADFEEREHLEKTGKPLIREDSEN